MDRNDAAAGGSDGVARPDFEPTINQAEPPGFVIDGTDSFAVPGPGDGLPPAGSDGPTISRARILVTAGSVLAGLVFVVAVGSGGDAGTADDSRVRTGEESALAPGWWDEEASTELAGPIGPNDDDTLARLAEGDDAAASATTEAYEYEYDEYTVPTYEFSEEEYASDPYEYEDYEYEEYDPGDYDYDYTPRYNRRSSNYTYTPPRPRVTTPPATTTTTSPPTTSTTTPPTPSTSTTSPSTSTTVPRSSTTTTQPRPQLPVWEPVTSPSACATVQLWVGGKSLVAQIGAALHRSVDGGRTWAPFAAPAQSDVRAFAEVGNSLWLGTAAGVFDGGTQAVGQLPDVHALGADADGSAVYALAGTPTALREWDGDSWNPVDAPQFVGKALQGIVVLDDHDVLVGTDAGVFGLEPNGSWTQVSSEGVSGSPALGSDGRVAWRLLSGDGVLVRNAVAAGGTWSTTRSQAYPKDVSGLAWLPDGRLIAVRAGGAFSSADGGASWPALQPAPGFSPTGVVHVDRRVETFVWSADCKIARLADPGS